MKLSQQMSIAQCLYHCKQLELMRLDNKNQQDRVGMYPLFLHTFQLNTLVVQVQDWCKCSLLDILCKIHLLLMSSILWNKQLDLLKQDCKKNQLGKECMMSLLLPNMRQLVEWCYMQLVQL